MFEVRTNNDVIALSSEKLLCQGMDLLVPLWGQQKIKQRLYLT
jgi:hypothetical protein